MNSTDYKTECLAHLLYLKYAMAADFESLDLLAQLETRRVEIDWDNPSFLQHSADMRAQLPENSQSAGQESFQPSLDVLFQEVCERAAQNEEVISGHLPFLRDLVEDLKEQVELRKVEIDLSKRVLRFTTALLEIHARLIDRLEVLGADTDCFNIPTDLLVGP